MAETNKHTPFSRIRAPLIILILSLVCTFVIDKRNSLERIENIIFDYLVTSHRTDTQLPDEISVVLIDESSLQTMDPILGSFPWPRSVYADLLDYFDMGGARGVVFDILLTERERLTAEDVGSLTESDQRLVNASANSQLPYHAAMFLNEKNVISSTLNRPLPANFLQQFGLKDAEGFTANRTNDYVLPFHELTSASPHLGIVSIDPDSDGIYRRVRLFWEYQQGVYPALSTAPLLEYLNADSVELEDDTLLFADRSIQVDADENYLVNYYGDYAPYSMAGILVSMIKINKGEIEDLPVYPDEFADKIVFIGASALGLDDIKATPIDPKSPGVFIHASIAGNILDQDMLTRAATWINYTLATIFASIVIGVVFRIPNLSVQLFAPIILSIIYWTWITTAFESNQVYQVTLSFSAIMFSWLGSFAYLGFTDGADKRKVKRMLSQYVSEAVLNEAMNSHDDILKAQVGRRESMSVLFSDVRNFTGISESEPPEKVVQLLNCHFKEMSEAIFKYQGTLDKFIGDALMAFWGAPIYVENHSELSLLAAMEMVDRLQVVNEELKTLEMGPIDVGIGINSGDVILGNIGSERKLDYTIIGDSVNLASRLEGITKNYGYKIVISESTHQQISLDIPFLLLDEVRVKGKQEPIKIYAPLGTLGDDETTKIFWKKQAAIAYGAFTLYQSRQWPEAKKLLDTLKLEAFKQLYLNRCDYFIENTPASDWDGVNNLTSK